MEVSQSIAERDAALLDVIRTTTESPLGHVKRLMSAGVSQKALDLALPIAAGKRLQQTVQTLLHGDTTLEARDAALIAVLNGSGEDVLSCVKPLINAGVSQTALDLASQIAVVRDYPFTAEALKQAIVVLRSDSAPKQALRVNPSFFL